MTQLNFDASKYLPQAPQDTTPAPAAEQPVATQPETPTFWQDPPAAPVHDSVAEFLGDMYGEPAPQPQTPPTTPHNTPATPPAFAQVQQTHPTPHVPLANYPAARYLPNGGVGMSIVEIMKAAQSVPLHSSVVNSDHPEFEYVALLVPRHLDDVTNCRKVVYGNCKNPPVFYIGGGYTEQERELLMVWIPEIMNTESELLGKRVSTVEHVFEHCDLVHKQQHQENRSLLRMEERELKLQRDKERLERQRVQTEKAQDRVAAKELREKQEAEFAAAHDEWLEACRVMRDEDALHEAAWRAGVSKKQDVMAEWEAYVKHLRETMRASKGRARPDRPLRKQYITG